MYVEMENLREIAARVAENDPASDTLADDWVRFTSPAILPAMVPKKTYFHTYIHTHTYNTYIHKHIHTYTHTYIHTYTYIQYIVHT